MNWVYDMATWQFSILLTSVAVCMACGAHFLVRRFVSPGVLVRHNDVAGFVASLIGVIYAVLLSFVVVVVWQEYDAAGVVAQKEASAVGDLYHLSYAVPDPAGAQLRRQLSAYINVMIDQEWPSMQHGQSSRRADILGHSILRSIVTLPPRNVGQTQIRGEAIRDVQTFFDARRDRLNENKTSLPRILWATLIMGAMVTIGFTFLFGMDSGRLQIVMTAGLTVVIALMFVLIIELDFPFRGDTKVQPGMWADLQQEMGRGLTEDTYRP